MKKCFAKWLNLKIIQLQLYFLIWFQTAETLTDQLPHLGQNVTINCDLDVKEIYWLLLKLPHPPVMILRTLSAGPFYYNEQSRHKYSVQSKHHLFINNVTHDELGVYYCVNTGKTGRKFSNGTRLHIIDPTSESQPSNCFFIYTLISTLMNAVLLIVIIGLVVVLVIESKRTRKGLKLFEDIDPQELTNQLQDSTHTQYTAAQMTFRP